MPIDIGKLGLPEWEFKTEAAGEWGVSPYSIKAVIQVENFLALDDGDAIEGVRSLMRVVCKKHVVDGEVTTKDDPTPAELDAFSDGDIQNFAAQFLDENQSMIEVADENLIKQQDQSDAEFLLTVLQAENEKRTAEVQKMVSTLQPNLDGLLGSSNSGIRGVSQQLISQNEQLKKAYGSLDPGLQSPSPATLFRHTPIRNPVHETNDHLGDMNQRLDNLIGFGENALGIMNGLQIASAEFLEKFSTEAHNTSKAAKSAIFVAGIAVLISVLQIFYTEFWRVPQDAAAMEAALVQVSSEFDVMQTLQETTSAEIAAAVSASDDINTALLQNIQQLLQEQGAREQAILAALESLTDSLDDPRE